MPEHKQGTPGHPQRKQMGVGQLPHPPLHWRQSGKLDQVNGGGWSNLHIRHSVHTKRGKLDCRLGGPCAPARHPGEHGCNEQYL